MRTQKEIEDKAIQLEKMAFEIKNRWNLSKADEIKLEQLKSAYTTLMYVLGYKQKSIYFDCNKCRVLEN